MTKIGTHHELGSAVLASLSGPARNHHRRKDRGIGAFDWRLPELVVYVVGYLSHTITRNYAFRKPVAKSPTFKNQHFQRLTVSPAPAYRQTLKELPR